MNINEIKEIIKVLEKTDIVEFELERSGERVRIKKGSEEPHLSVTKIEKQRATEHPDESVLKTSGELNGNGGEGVAEKQHFIKAPIVGTFYRSPSPDAESYVEIGTQVKKGQIVCIIEAMKLMNEIESDTDGKIVKILTENAHPVEFGEPLFAIEPV